ncbi:MAG TPA: cytochrome c peroxidase [Kofleriaceae bacterium]|nr:cytochrome c peroxidase [Kofleriaceae bacterium]
MRAPHHVLIALVLAACSSEPSVTRAQLGALVFADPGLSNPPGQACADCHAARVAFRDPESSRATSMGAVAGRFGVRGAPSAMYASHVPPLHRDPHDGRWIGGLFWDGRAQSLEDQAAGPLLNPLEMNNPDKASVVAAVRRAAYAGAFRELFGPGALDDVDAGFARITAVIAAYERTRTFAPFSSKYDRYLAGELVLDEAERRGLAIFEDPARGNCASCHPSRPGPDGTPPMFTDFGYANLGIPKYMNNKFYEQPAAFNPDGARYIDHGLMATVGDRAQDGKFRVPTLRNVAVTAPYGHNGYFENLPYLLDFLSSRDVGSRDVGTCSRATPDALCAWPGPEVPATVDRRVGHLGLSAQDIDDLAAFLSTLTDEVPAS